MKMVPGYPRTYGTIKYEVYGGLSQELPRIGIYSF